MNPQHVENCIIKLQRAVDIPGRLEGEVRSILNEHFSSVHSEAEQNAAPIVSPLSSDEITALRDAMRSVIAPEKRDTLPPTAAISFQQ